MKVIDLLKRLTYGREVSRLVWHLHLSAILRKLYYILTRPRNNVANVEVAGVSVRFKVHSPWEWRALETVGGIGGEQHILELLVPKVRADDVVYDIGSNFGVYSILLAKAAGPKGTVIAFEPEAHAHDHLQENVSLNGLTNVRSFCLALGDQAGEAKLFLGEVTGASCLTRPITGEQCYELVEVVEGDRLVQAEGLPLPNLVKIDVEGHEYAVICGLRRTLGETSCRLVCCEVHPQLLPAQIKPDQVVEVLRSLGFNHIEPCKRGTSEYHIFAQKE
jgi:FkbM family methyltransferase